jgi:REP element-mobilizing transposase RayT
MSEPGRKGLPHATPLWIAPSREIYFLTICARDRASRPLLPIAARLLAAVRHTHDRGKWWAHLALVMPDHAHLLVRCADDLPGVVRAWKHWTAHHLGVAWQRDFFEHRLRHDESLREKADYILANPVRAGLVPDGQSWPHFWMPGNENAE